jgi:hypothetical protein
MKRNLAESSSHVAESSSYVVEFSSHLVECISHLADSSSHLGLTFFGVEIKEMEHTICQFFFCAQVAMFHYFSTVGILL